ncbi:MAG: haloacid dehalogenase type II [Vulcanimicrobiaceae bacterium]
MLPKAILFDVNETLLDLSALDPLFVDAFGEKSTRRVWFAQMLQLAMSATIVGSYAEFGELGRVALEMTASKRGVVLDGERKRRILDHMRALPVHGDVVDGLNRLRAADVRLAVLTNSTETVLEAQLAYARIREYFSEALSIDSVRRYKPAPETYAYAAARLELEPAEIVLVAAHEWDVAGAMHAGLRAGFVARHGTALNPLEPRPEFVAPTVRAMAEAILAKP